MKVTYNEFRRLSAGSLRNLCVRMNWYTAGDNDEYGHLLYDLAEHKVNLSTEDIIEIAKDIYKHTALEDLGDYEIANIAFKVNRACTVTFEKRCEG